MMMSSKFSFPMGVLRLTIPASRPLILCLLHAWNRSWRLSPSLRLTNFNCDGRVSDVLEKINYKARSIPAGVPVHFEDPENESSYRAVDHLHVDDFEIPSKEDSDKEDGSASSSSSAALTDKRS
eukprot:1155881-Rhodomonas_salina.1